MRVGFVCAGLAALALASAASAQQSQFPLSTVFSAMAGNVPAGWSRNMDGSYKQAESGVLCPKSFLNFNFQTIDGPSPDAPNVLGTCHYSDGNGRDGSIRVRRYVENWGDNLARSANDKLLMATDGSAPPMLMRPGTDRKSGGARLTVTVVRNGLLVDCSVWQPASSTPDRMFPLYCSTLTKG